MFFATDPAVNSFVKVKRQNEPLWLKVITVNAGLGTLVGQVLAATIAYGAQIGENLPVTYAEILDTQPAAATPVHASAALPKPPSNTEKQRMGNF